MIPELQARGDFLTSDSSSLAQLESAFPLGEDVSLPPIKLNSQINLSDKNDEVFLPSKETFEFSGMDSETKPFTTEEDLPFVSWPTLTPSILFETLKFDSNVGRYLLPGENPSSEESSLEKFLNPNIPDDGKSGSYIKQESPPSLSPGINSQSDSLIETFFGVPKGTLGAVLNDKSVPTAPLVESLLDLPQGSLSIPESPNPSGNAPPPLQVFSEHSFSTDSFNTNNSLFSSDEPSKTSGSLVDTKTSGNPFHLSNSPSNSKYPTSTNSGTLFEEVTFGVLNGLLSFSAQAIESTYKTFVYLPTAAVQLSGNVAQQLGVAAQGAIVNPTGVLETIATLPKQPTDRAKKWAQGILSNPHGAATRFATTIASFTGNVEFEVSSHYANKYNELEFQGDLFARSSVATEIALGAIDFADGVSGLNQIFKGITAVDGLPIFVRSKGKGSPLLDTKPASHTRRGSNGDNFDALESKESKNVSGDLFSEAATANNPDVEMTYQSVEMHLTKHGKDFEEILISWTPEEINNAAKLFSEGKILMMAGGGSSLPVLDVPDHPTKLLSQKVASNFLSNFSASIPLAEGSFARKLVYDAPNLWALGHIANSFSGKILKAEHVILAMLNKAESFVEDGVQQSWFRGLGVDSVPSKNQRLPGLDPSKNYEEPDVSFSLKFELANQFAINNVSRPHPFGIIHVVDRSRVVIPLDNNFEPTGKVPFEVWKVFPIQNDSSALEEVQFPNFSVPSNFSSREKFFLNNSVPSEKEVRWYWPIDSENVVFSVLATKKAFGKTTYEILPNASYVFK
jgi:hypothetical protein